MASTVYTVQEVLLQDNTKVTLKPLPIKKQRVFMEHWEKLPDAKTENDGMDIFLEMAGLGIEKQLKEKHVKDLAQEDGETEEDFEARKESAWKDYLEEALDMPTIRRILDVCGGLKLDDPNLQAAVEAAMRETEETDQDGQN